MIIAQEPLRFFEDYANPIIFSQSYVQPAPQTANLASAPSAIQNPGYGPTYGAVPIPSNASLEDPTATTYRPFNSLKDNLKALSDPAPASDPDAVGQPSESPLVSRGIATTRKIVLAAPVEKYAIMANLSSRYYMNILSQALAGPGFWGKLVLTVKKEWTAKHSQCITNALCESALDGSTKDGSYQLFVGMGNGEYCLATDEDKMNVQRLYTGTKALPNYETVITDLNGINVVEYFKKIDSKTRIPFLIIPTAYIECAEEKAGSGIYTIKLTKDDIFYKQLLNKYNANLPTEALVAIATTDN